MMICARPDTRIYRVYLAVVKRSGSGEPKEGKLAVFLPRRGPKPLKRIRVRLAMRGKRCWCYMNGQPAGPMPEAARSAYGLLKALNEDSPRNVDIDYDGILLGPVVSIVEQCRKAKIASVTFVDPLPMKPKK